MAKRDFMDNVRHFEVNTAHGQILYSHGGSLAFHNRRITPGGSSAAFHAIQSKLHWFDFPYDARLEINPVDRQSIDLVGLQDEREIYRHHLAGISKEMRTSELFQNWLHAANLALQTKQTPEPA